MYVIFARLDENFFIVRIRNMSIYWNGEKHKYGYVD